MGRPNRSVETRQQILDSAAQIFSRQGYRATTVAEIAGTVGLSKATLYHYFQNKEEILVCLYEAVMADAIQNAEEIVASIDEPLEILHRLIAYRAQTTCERQSIYKVFFEEEEEVPPSLTHTLIEQRRRYEEILRTQVDRYLAALRYPPPIEVTIFINSCLGAANWVYKWYRPGGPLTPEQLGNHIADYVLRPLAVRTGGSVDGRLSPDASNDHPNRN